MVLVVKNLSANAEDVKYMGSIGKIWRRVWHPTPIFLPREPDGQRSLAGCGPQGRKEWDTTEATLHVCT